MGRWWQKWSLSYSHPYVVNFNPKTLIGNILIVTQGTHDFNAILSCEFNWRTLRSMVASLRSLLPQFLGGMDEPVKELVPPLAEDDGFIPGYSKYISPPRATTVAPWHHNVVTSRRCRPVHRLVAMSIIMVMFVIMALSVVASAYSDMVPWRELLVVVCEGSSGHPQILVVGGCQSLRWVGNHICCLATWHWGFQ